MKNFTYTQTLVMGIIFAAIGYVLGSGSSYLSSLLVVIGDVLIVASIVMIIKKKVSHGPKKETKETRASDEP